MAGLISADPARLEAYTEATVPAIARALAAVEAYREALAAFNAAEPNDLDSRLVDRSGALDATLQGLALLDELPAAFAAALRQLDTAYDPAGPGAQVLTADDPLALYGAAAAHLVLDRIPLLRGGDEIRQVGQWLDQERNRLSRLGEWFGHLPETIDLFFKDVTTTVRRTVVIVEETTADSWRRATLTVDELEHIIRRWSVSLDLSDLCRAAPVLKALGMLSPPAAPWENR